MLKNSFEMEIIYDYNTKELTIADFSDLEKEAVGIHFVGVESIKTAAMAFEAWLEMCNKFSS